MSQNRTVIRRKSDTDTPRLAWEGLNPDLLGRARDRIRRFAWLLLVVMGMGAVLDIGFFFMLVGRFDPVWLGAGAATMAMSMGLVLASRNKRITHLTLLRLGLGYEVVICLYLAYLMPQLVHIHTGGLPYVTWVEPVIILFPLIVPSPPKVTLTAAVAAAATRPLGLFLVSLGGITVPPAIYVVSVLSPAFAVILAYAGSRIVYGMNVDLADAQRLGSYELESPLGSGGMGEVWRARHQLLARPGAIKLILPETLGRNPEHQQTTLARFEREAQATALMESPHTIQLYDFGIAQDGTFYYVMELLRGLDLEVFVDRFGPVRPARVIHLMLQACESLGESHERGLIHRDIKPANIYLCHFARHVDFVKVLDFGLVKDRGNRDEEATITREDTVKGTPAFMAPEQILGEEIDGRADIYGLGCVMYWLLTGDLPFRGKNALETIAMHLDLTPTAPSTRTEQAVPPELDRIVLACLEKKASLRPQNIDHLAEMLSTCKPGQPWTAELAWGWWRRNLPSLAHDEVR